MDFTQPHAWQTSGRFVQGAVFAVLVSGNTFDQRLARDPTFLQEARLDTKEMQVPLSGSGAGRATSWISRPTEQFTLDEARRGRGQRPGLQPEMVVQVEWLDVTAHRHRAAVGDRAGGGSEHVAGDEERDEDPASTKPAKLSNGVTVQVPEFYLTGREGSQWIRGLGSI